jgi:hypothetical protein
MELVLVVTVAVMVFVVVLGGGVVSVGTVGLMLLVLRELVASARMALGRRQEGVRRLEQVGPRPVLPTPLPNVIQDATGLLREGNLLVGMWRGHMVRIGNTRAAPRQTYVQVDDAPIGFTLSRRRDSRYGQRRVPGGVQTGDAAFDRWVRVGGHAGRALAALDDRTRERVRELLRFRPLVLMGGQVTCHGSIVLRPSHILATLDAAVELADLVRCDDIEAGLADRARRDCVPQVRARALLAVRDAEGVAAELLTDTVPGVRLIAASRAGAGAVLVDLALDTALTPALRRDALAAAAQCEVDLYDAVIECLGDPDVRPAAIDIAVSGGVELRAALLDVVGTVRDPVRARAVLAALSPLGNAAQRGLIELLSIRGARVGAAKRLGEVGDEEAIPALRSVAQGGLLANAAVAEAARWALRAIHARVGHRAGGLEIADLPGGLAVVPERGEISLWTDG